MNLSDINNQINLNTGASVLDYTYQQRTISFNNWLYRINTWILQAQDEWDADDKNNTNFSEATTNLIANQTDYALPATSIRIKRLEVTYDGVNWYRANPIDLNEIGDAENNPATNSNFTTTNPFYDIKNNSVVLYPAPTVNVTDGLKMWYDRLFSAISYTSEANNDLLTGTKTPGFDDNFHELLSLGVSYDWNSKKKQDKSLMADINLMKADLINLYGSKQKDRNYSMNSAVDLTSEYN